MAQDLRELFEKDIENVKKTEMPKGHEARFLERLNKNLEEESPKENKNFYWIKIAAVFVIALTTSFFLYQTFGVKSQPTSVAGSSENKSVENKEKSPVYLSDISPEFKKVEDYYLANINAELAQLNITNENKELIDSFMAQLSELDDEYQRLNEEIKDTGVNEETVSALINNLQLRLDLLFKLKNKLVEIKKSSLADVQGSKM